MFQSRSPQKIMIAPERACKPANLARRGSVLRRAGCNPDLTDVLMLAPLRQRHALPIEDGRSEESDRGL